MTDPAHQVLHALLLATFADESRDLVQGMSTGLLRLERDEAPAERSALIEDIMRSAHSLKGAARAVGLDSVEALAHDLEELFGRLQAGVGAHDARTFDLAHRALDEIGALSEPEKGGDGGPRGIEALRAELGAAAGEALAPGPDAFPPAAEAPVAGDQAAASTFAPGQSPSPDETVRVATAKLDALMAQVGELLVARSGGQERLAELATVGEAVADVAAKDRLEALRRKLEHDSRRLDQVAAALGDEVRRVRMLPVSTVFEAFPRMVRDMAAELGKEVALALSGEDTEVDRSVLEQIKAPLTHMLRNSVDHGLESSEARTRAGKPPEGVVSLSAAQEGARLVLRVSDDGAGIDSGRLRAAAVASGVMTREDADALSEPDALRLIFASGMSTKEAVTGLSGRGVGMNVVERAVERLHGSIDVESQPGRGTSITLSLPLSVATTHCLLVEAAGQTFGVPIGAVERTVSVASGQIRRTQGHEAIAVDAVPVALLRLATVLGIKGPSGPETNGAAAAMPAVIVASGQGRVALAVDRLAGAQELAIRGLPPPLLRVRNLAGAAVLGTGTLVTIVNVGDLLRSAAGVRAAPVATVQPMPEEDRRPRVLVVDDSMTIRTLNQNILEAAGYRTRGAADGLEAWSLLQEDPCDLLVSDVEMPRMDGRALTSRVRADERLKNLPVILVTAQDSQEQREAGIATGADAYIVKSGFDQDELLEAVGRLV